MRDENKVTKKGSSVFKTRRKSKRVPKDYCFGDDGDEDVEPIGKTFFHVEIAKSHLGHDSKYQMLMPSHFARTLPNKAVPVVLTRGGRSWETTYHGENSAYYKRFDRRWKAFAEDNILKVGDVCVFELLEHSDTALKFKVRVLRGDFPSVLVKSQDGTIEKPIIVD